jgi:hypothetical protein
VKRKGNGNGGVSEYGSGSDWMSSGEGEAHTTRSANETILLISKTQEK